MTAPPARVNLIVAWDRNRLIGRNGGLPWHLPEDLQHFRKLTMGHPILMGRRTWESIGRPLPGRRSIVVTRNPAWSASGCEAAGSLPQALALCAGAPEAFVIGGAQLFGEALPLARRLFLTQVDAAFEGDVHFPPLDLSGWTRIEHDRREAGPARPATLEFSTYEAPLPTHPRHGDT